MRRYIMMILWLVMVTSVVAEKLPVWFDTFSSEQKSLSEWQSFKAAYQLGFEEDGSLIGGQALKVKFRFSKEVPRGILIWRFPDVQMEKFCMRIKLPREAKGIYLRMVSNNTKGDAAFFKPWCNNGPTRIDLPISTKEGDKIQPASPLPVNEWVTYEVSMLDDLFYFQSKKPEKRENDFSLLNTGRGALNLDAGSQPATEVFWITFEVPEDSKLFGKELEFLVDLAEIY